MRRNLRLCHTCDCFDRYCGRAPAAMSIELARATKSPCHSRCAHLNSSQCGRAELDVGRARTIDERGRRAPWSGVHRAARGPAQPPGFMLLRAHSEKAVKPPGASAFAAAMALCAAGPK